MEQYNENQYDDDLTIGNEEYDDSYYTGAEDLFEVSPDEESPISRLKSLILSIDWEITDEVLLLFNEELVKLRDTWAGEKINLVYVQALEKISKYIYYKKADSHPSAIKLLLTLYHNLEKIVTSEDLSEEQKKELLFEDVKRYEQLKAHIKKDDFSETEEKPYTEEVEVQKSGEELRNLKAIVLGIDWEITDEDLNALREEVVKLETLYAGNKPRLILLQGLGTLGAYIKLKKSDAHAEAFKLLHLFCGSLGEIVESNLSLDEEKAILFPAVEKFNSFKTLIGSTITPDAIAREQEQQEEVEAPEPDAPAGVITPAFADIPEDEVHGFQPDEEAHALGYEHPEDVVSHVADFFPDEVDEPEQVRQDLDSQGETVEEASEMPSVSADVALQGVDVEEDDTEDDEEEFEATGAPIASLSGDLPPSDITSDEEAGLIEKDVAPDVTEDTDSAPEIAEKTQSVATEAIEEQPLEEPPAAATDHIPAVDAETALQGVEVETEADDDSDEESLPQVDGKLAPALAAEPIEEELADADQAQVSPDESVSEDIEGVIADFFGDDESAEPELESLSPDEALDTAVAPNDAVEPDEPSVPADIGTGGFMEDAVPPVSVDKEIALQGVDVESEADDDTDEPPLPALGEEVAPALSFEDEPSSEIVTKDGVVAITETEDQIEDKIENFFDDSEEEIQAPIAALSEDAPEEDTVVFAEDTEDQDEQDLSDFVERLDDFFGDEENKQVGTIDDASASSGLIAALGGLEESDVATSFETEEEEVVFELAEDLEYLELSDIEALQLNIDSLGDANDTSVLQDLNSDLESLKEKCADHPLELSVLRLVASMAKKYENVTTL